MELERPVPTGDAVLPYLWVRGTSAERFHDHLRRQPAVEHTEVVHHDGSNLLLRVGWQLSAGTLIRYVTGGAEAESGLTRVQCETLARAFDAGYFEEPRRVTLKELAADLEVSPRAVSRRLRRGVANVLRGRFGERE